LLLLFYRFRQLITCLEGKKGAAELILTKQSFWTPFLNCQNELFKVESNDRFMVVEMRWALTRAYFRHAVNNRLTRLWPRYILTQLNEIFLIREDKFEKFGIFRGNFLNPGVADPTRPDPSNKKMIRPGLGQKILTRTHYYMAAFCWFFFTSINFFGIKYVKLSLLWLEGFFNLFWTLKIFLGLITICFLHVVVLFLSFTKLKCSHEERYAWKFHLQGILQTL